MRFTKMHGLGNDFIVIDALSGVDIADKGAFARTACDRRFGIGADGLVLIRPSTAGDFRMRIFNPDGSEPEMCGNAIRCVAKYLYERGLSKERVIMIETRAGMMAPEVIVSPGGQVSGVRVDMGAPRLERERIPMRGAPGRVISERLVVGSSVLPVTAVSMGNPHCVVFVPDVEQVDLETLGPAIERHRVFPARTNVEFVAVIDPGRVRVRVWERGAGPTLACGTGACAVTVAGVLTGHTECRVSVELPGGILDIEWAENGRVYMTGPATEVFRGKVVSIGGSGG